MTDRDIYSRRLAEARARIAADQAAGRGPTRLDLAREEHYFGLLQATAPGWAE